jgi:hypothetical protein
MLPGLQGSFAVRAVVQHYGRGDAGGMFCLVLFMYNIICCNVKSF